MTLMWILCMQDKNEQLVEGKLDWKGKPVYRNKHGGAKSSFLVLGKAVLKFAKIHLSG